MPLSPPSRLCPHPSRPGPRQQGGEVVVTAEGKRQRFWWQSPSGPAPVPHCGCAELLCLGLQGD